MTPRRRHLALALVSLLVATSIVIPLVYLNRPAAPPRVQLTAPQRDCTLLGHFSSEQDLIARLKLTPAPGPWVMFGGLAAGPDGARTETAYSGTNVQVEGVDEADIVKTDGVNVYASSDGTDGSATAVVRAYPPASAALLTRIPSHAWGSNLFLDGDRLVVIEGAGAMILRYGGPFPYYAPQTAVLVYNVSDPGVPTLVRNVTVDGWYAGARMIGDVVYLVANAWIYLGDNDTLVLPAIATDGASRALTYGDVGYFRDSEGSHVDTIVVAVNVRTDDPPAFESFLTNGASQIYASLDDLYLASTEWVYRNDEVFVEQSTVHKVALGGTPQYVCSAVVPGTVLNQYSMDERDGDLRVATTLGSWTPQGAETSAGVYVLDDGMHPLGQVTGLAPGERVYAARFLTDRAYLVTYRMVDPLFVIDLSDAASPRVLGFLKVTGVSEYLHPYGDRYLIGLGSNDPNGTGRLRGIKVSLFDVGDVANPREVASVAIGDGENEWAYSEAQSDAHAFLFIPGRDEVVFPVATSQWDPDGSGSTWWSGAYVLAVTPQGVTVRGRVTHGDAQEYWSEQVRRSLYIGDVLYTVSNGFVVANNLDTLAEVARVPL